MGPHEPLVTVSPQRGAWATSNSGPETLDPAPGGGPRPGPLWGGYSRERLVGVIFPYHSVVGSSQMAPNLGTRLCPLPGSSESSIRRRRRAPRSEIGPVNLGRGRVPLPILPIFRIRITSHSSMTTFYMTSVFFFQIRPLEELLD